MSMTNIADAGKILDLSSHFTLKCASMGQIALPKFCVLGEGLRWVIQVIPFSISVNECSIGTAVAQITPL